MYLIDWAQANWLMAITTLVLIAIPVVIVIVVFSKKSGDSAEHPGEG